MDKPLITIVIVNYKTADMVCQVVQSAKDSAAADHIGIHTVVVDNGSQDGSVETFKARHPDIEVIDAGGNLGFAHGNNLALKDLDTPYAMLLNSDAFLEEGTLRRLVDVMEAHPEVGVVGPRILNPDRTDQDYPLGFPTVPEMIRRAVKGPQFPAQGKDPQTPIKMERIHGCCLMARRTLWEEIGLLDEQFFMYDEDMDWCLRAANAGWELWLIPDALVVHLGGQTSGRAPSGRRTAKTERPFNARMAYELRKSRYILYRKHKSMLDLVLLKLFTDIILLVSVGFLFLKAIKNKSYTENMREKCKGTLHILRINPFKLDVKKTI